MGVVDSDTFDDNPLDTTESLDSDEVRNDDGDEVADPPERWIEAKDEESLDERLGDEVPDVTVDSDEGGGLELTPDDELDRLDPSVHGRERGQIDGTPEDGDSFYDIVE
jgi:hypothetical protein